ncbi:membrane protein insertase YidC [Buchnera aphidicola]|uniref:Membrane protein insertase YidC, partial n=1 Tax=Buchnera aphidicola (Cinara laricifoliae) TaxID=2518977 RepID=A0A451DAS2_9GAMM|nr:membrane protein insertase YidC [Buchnera aphidicola]VFP83464.1 Membrane protein insertase YidC [Buchnera aphidicola (Cinara laricifoliae)]
MIYFKRIFFIISCVLFSFLVWNFWNTHFSINQNNLKVNNSIHKIYNINDNNKDQLINIKNNFISSNINLLDSNIQYTSFLNHYRYLKISSLFTLFQNKKEIIFKFINNIDNIYFNNFFKIFSDIQIGSKIQNKILKISENSKFRVNRKLLYILSYPLYKLLSFFNSKLKNWGISIILVTILLKIITYPATKLQYISILKMKLLKLEIKKIKSEFCDDLDTMNKKILLLYKSKKVNPFITLLSAVLQIPIFLSFYYVLVSSVELHNAPFFLWIRDLSHYDPYYVLPICISLSVLLIQLNELNFNKIFTRKNFLCILPVLFTGFFIWLPSGLALYYLTGNIFTCSQQWIIRRNFIKNK